MKWKRWRNFLPVLFGIFFCMTATGISSADCQCPDLVPVQVLCTGEGCAPFTYYDCGTEVGANCQVCTHVGFWYGCCDGSFLAQRARNGGQCAQAGFVQKREVYSASTGRSVRGKHLAADSRRVALVILAPCGGYVRTRV